MGPHTRIDRRTLASVLGASALSGIANAQDAQMEPPTKLLNQLLEASVANGSVPGIAAMVVSQDAVLYQGSFGVRRLESDKEIRADSVFRIASMTKPITSVAALQLVERGLLRLDDPVRKYVSEIGDCQVIMGWHADGQPNLRPPKREITVKHLLSHTAGFGYPMWNSDVQKYHQVAKLPGPSKKQSLKSVLTFDPGDRWQYGISTDWLGLVIEAVAGKSLGQVLQESIFRPLQMRSTAFRFSESMRSRVVAMHQRDKAGVLEATDFELDQNPEFESGGAGLYSTAEDYAHFVQMILGRGKWNGQRILKQETISLMTTNAIGMIEVGPLLTSMPEFSNDVDFLSNVKKRWGLGFLLNTENVPGRRKSGSLCWAGLTNCYFWIDPISGIGGLLLTQLLPFGDRKVLPLFRQFEAAIYANQR